MSNQRKPKRPQEAQEAAPGAYSGIEPAVASEGAEEAPEGAQAPPTGKPFQTAFLVLIEDDGTAYATNDLNMDVVLARPPTLGDMYRSCAEIMKDITAQETAQRTIALQMQAASAVAEQQRSAKIAAKLAEKGIHVPGR